MAASVETTFLATVGQLNSTTTGAQVYNGAVILQGDAFLNAGSADITFFGTVNAANSGSAALVVNTVGTTTFSQTVGVTTPLEALITDISGGGVGTTVINGGSIETIGDLIFNDAVTLGADTILTGTDIRFGSTLNSADFDCAFPDSQQWQQRLLGEDHIRRLRRRDQPPGQHHHQRGWGHDIR